MLQMHKHSSTPKMFGEKKKKDKKVLPYLQRIGKSLMFPIAMLPIAAIFLRISALVPDTTEFSKLVGSILGSIGNAVFGPILPVLFAIGVAFGLSKDQRGEAAIVGFVTMMLLQIFLSLSGQGFAGAGIGLVDQIYGKVNVRVEPLLNPGTNQAEVVTGFAGLLSIYKYNAGSNSWELNPGLYTNVMVNNVLNGIAVGILVSVIYNNFQGIELPSVLGFFSGRRLIPVLALIIGVLFSIIWAILFPWIAWCVYYLSYYMGEATGNRWANAGIMGAYGFINRLLIPFGLHHIPNTLFWFAIGQTQDVNGQIILGDINGFISGAPSWTDASGNVFYNNSGTFQSGIFPFMMFGLPAIAFAFYKLADNKEQAKKVAALLFGAAGIAFFTGITEPIEFAFMFISPGLYLIYALLCGICGFVVGIFQIQLGFGFSAGLIDYVLSIPKSLEIIKAKVDGGAYSKADAVLANPGMLLPIGLIFSVIYYYTFKLCIVKFNMAAPGRSPNLLVDEKEDIQVNNTYSGLNKESRDAAIIIDAIGIDNLDKVEWCTTRLRLTVKDNSLIDINRIKKTRSRGEIKSGTTGFQIIIGTSVEILGNEINRLLNSKDEISKILDSSTNKPKEAVNESKTEIKQEKLTTSKIYSPCIGKIQKLDVLKDDAFKNKLVGDGLVINSKDGKVYAPFDGIVSMIADTKHAISIQSADGNNILIHIGIDTITLNGKGFNIKVKQDQVVKKGELLLEFDKKLIKDKKLDNRVIVLLTNDSKSKISRFTKEESANKQTVLFTIK